MFPATSSVEGASVFLCDSTTMAGMFMLYIPERLEIDR